MYRKNGDSGEMTQAAGYVSKNWSFQAGFVTDLHGLGQVIWTRLRFLHQ